MNTRLAPVYPGEILREEFLKPLGITQYRLAHDIGVHPRRINEIVHGNYFRPHDPASVSIRINEQKRICFRFEDGDAFDVEIVDYH